MSDCTGFGKIKYAWFVENRYNYPKKFRKALEDGNTKYIEKLIKKRIVICLDTSK